jgi:RNA polymerase sigma factor (sigma-70 family)
VCRAEQGVAQLCAMPDALQRTSPAWDSYQDLIIHTVKATYPNLSAENYDILLREIKNKFPINFAGDFRAVSVTVKGIAGPFIEQRRRHHWETHKASILSKIREVLPPVAREFEIYYTTHLLDQVSARFDPEIWSTADVIAEKLEALVNEVVATSVPQLLTGTGELRDEELVRLYRAGYARCRTMLIERYAAKLHDLAPRIIHVKNLCPSMEYPPQFAKDVAQEVSLKLLKKLDSYKLDSKFETWVGTIIENEARTLGARKQLGRAEAGPRTYISFEKLVEETADTLLPVIESRERRQIMHKALLRHRAGGIKDAKSADAIELRYFEDLKTPEVARRIGATESYVARLISDDYAKVRQILKDDFGLTGTEL